MSMTAGRIRDMSKAVYHGDPCDSPSLSSHIANTLLDRSPRHAWLGHPKLNPDFKPVHKKIFDLGSAAHAMMLGDTETKFEIVKAKNWTTKAAKVARDLARKNGLIPILPNQSNELVDMVNVGQLQIAASESPFAFSDGEPEQTLVWQEETNYGPIWCRSRLDWFPRMGGIFHDYKTTGGSAHPDAFYNSAWDNGYYLQAAFYMRGIRAATRINPTEFRFVVQETKPPYALSICALTPTGVAEADLCVQEAIDLWGWCLANKKWPGYSGKVAYVDPPAWVLRRREARKERDHFLQSNGVDPKSVMIDWLAAG